MGLLQSSQGRAVGPEGVEQVVLVTVDQELIQRCRSTAHPECIKFNSRFANNNGFEYANVRRRSNKKSKKSRAARKKFNLQSQQVDFQQGGDSIALNDGVTSYFSNDVPASP